jgi:hypothetical protein
MKHAIEEIILERLAHYGLIEKPKCDCGCNSCHKAPKLLNTTITLSEGLQYHIEKKKPITENLYRFGSTSHVKLIQEVRTLWENGDLELKGDDLELFYESDLGKVGIYEGQKVLLDYPLLEIRSFEKWPREVLSRHGDIIFRFAKKAKGTNGEVAQYELIDKETGERWEAGFRTFSTVEDLEDRAENTIKPQGGRTSTQLEEKKKQPPLNKPKRGGPKKFYVYVRKPGGGIKKVNFGDTTGLKAKINNPKARKAFAARHKCAQAKDKTTPKYWSCRLPRYASLLGMKSNFSGFW